MERSRKRLILAGALYAVSASVVAAVLLYDAQAMGKVALFVLACALATAGTLVLPPDTRKLAAAAAGIFLTAAGLFSTVLGLDTREPSTDRPKAPALAKYTGRIGHGSAYGAYEWLAKREGQAVRLNMLIDLAPVERGGGSTREQVLHDSGTRGRNIYVVAVPDDVTMVSFRFLPRARDAADYVSAEFNDVVRISGTFRVVEKDPSVGSAQIYAVVLDPDFRRGVD
ncbi:MAG: hypothetical protein QOI64_2781 [Solirubrobacteraceae bacterium]|jgi:hypothetical protein|nr:hypothetical protein [Solirubrobacteraceae bacterium]